MIYNNKHENVLRSTSLPNVLSLPQIELGFICSEDNRGDAMVWGAIIVLHNAIDDFRGACAVKGNGAVAGHVKRVDHDDVFDALLFREETLTRHYFILKFDFSRGIRTNMGKTGGIFLKLQCNCHIVLVGSIIIKLINHRTLSVHGCQIWQR